jgi:hypothetical protein
LGKNKNIVALFHQVLSKRRHRPHNTIDDRMIIVGKKRDVQSLLR